MFIPMTSMNIHIISVSLFIESGLPSSLSEYGPCRLMFGLKINPGRWGNSERTVHVHDPHDLEQRTSRQTFMTLQVYRLTV